MKRISLAVTILLINSSIAGALPALQLYIDGADYDWDTETWIIEGQSQFDLYIVGEPREERTLLSDDELEHVNLVVSTDSDIEPTGTILINGEPLPDDQWVFGTPAFPPVAPPHGIFPAWHFTMEAGEFHQIGGIGDAVPDSDGLFFDPSEGYLDECNHQGEIKLYTIEVPEEITNLHFDALQIEDDDDDDDEHNFAPFSHDAGYIGAQTGVAENSAVIPEKLALLRSYPNPFNAVTTIEFNLAASSEISLELYDLQGRFVTSLTRGYYGAGKHSLIWDGVNNSGKPVATGAYLVRLVTDEYQISRPIVLLK